MSAVIQTLVLGVLVGAVFGFARQPIPAPSTLAGIAGVVGLWVGWSSVSNLIGRF